MLNSKEKYVVEFASERAEGKAEGEEKKARAIAKRMIIDGIPLKTVSGITELSLEITQELAAEIGANFDVDA